MDFCEKMKMKIIKFTAQSANGRSFYSKSLVAMSIVDRDDGPVAQLAVGNDMATLDAEDTKAMFDAIQEGRLYRAKASQDDVWLTSYFTESPDDGEPFTGELILELESASGQLFEVAMTRNGPEMSQLLDVLEHTFDPDYGMPVTMTN